MKRYTLIVKRGIPSQEEQLAGITPSAGLDFPFTGPICVEGAHLYQICRVSLLLHGLLLGSASPSSLGNGELVLPSLSGL